MVEIKIIEEAIAGNETALMEILNCYDGYIRRISTEVAYINGRKVMNFNQELYGILRTHLLLSIPKFRILEDKNGETTD